MTENQSAGAVIERAVQLPIGGIVLEGDLAIPENPRGVVLFAHGSGSSRRSARNRQVALGLHRAGYGTLLMDLLTAEEERIDRGTRELRFDIPLLAGRLTAAVDWLASQHETAGLQVAVFGASTGAAAALIASADRPDRVRAVISRGGRPDLAGDALGRVRAPTVLIVGGIDPVVLDLNRRAAAEFGAHVEIEVVSGAGHLFEEPGALQAVTELAVNALRRWLVP